MLRGRDKRAVKDALYEQLARVGRAASSSKRLELLDLLGQGEKSVEALAVSADLPIGNTSAHLKVLRTARLVATRRDGQHIYYRLAGQSVGGFYVALRDLAEEQYAELRDIAEKHFVDPDGLAPMDRRTLLARLRRGDVTLIDVRPADEFAAGHIPGAISVPIDQLNKRQKDLPKDTEIVAYCRGPYCLYAIDAVTALRRAGLQATRFEDSVMDWMTAGLRLEQGREPPKEQRDD